MFTMYGREIEVKTDAYVIPENWRFGSRLVASGWDKAAFRMSSSNYSDMSYAVNVTITGRTMQRMDGDYFIRVKIEFVGDGEPSTFSGGWMKVE